ncbi:MAG TPA: general stress protein CsbD [Opitutaceae bacterium]|nr:general stress protein CsbD [Opitutaceae bacterium]
MNKTDLSARWRAAQARLKQRFASLTDDDLGYVKGREEELLARLQERTGLSRDALERELNAECGD